MPVLLNDNYRERLQLAAGFRKRLKNGIDKKSSQAVFSFPVSHPSTGLILKAMAAMSDCEKWSLRWVKFLYLK